MERGHGVEHFGPAIQYTDAGRAAHLVTGEREEIAADFLNVDLAMAGALGGIDQGGDAEFARASAEFGGGINGAERVGNVRERKQFDRFVQKRIELRCIEQAVVASDGNVGQLCAGAFG